MTEQLAAIRARLAAYEQALWAHSDALVSRASNSWVLSFAASNAFEELSENAPTDLRALIDAHDADQARIAALEAALRQARDEFESEGYTAIAARYDAALNLGEK